MLTRVEIDEVLLQQAMDATGLSNRNAAVEACLREVVHLHSQGQIRRLFGKVQWEGNLSAMREGELPEWEFENSSSGAPEIPAEIAQ